MMVPELTRGHALKMWTSQGLQRSGSFHLFTIPYSPQLNAVEMVFSQLKSYVVSEFVKFPEKRKDLGTVIDESMAKITQEHIGNYYKHQATVVTQCLRGIAPTPDTSKCNEADTGGGRISMGSMTGHSEALG